MAGCSSSVCVYVHLWLFTARGCLYTGVCVSDYLLLLDRDDSATTVTTLKRVSVT